jgi:hypothetical protein
MLSREGYRLMITQNLVMKVHQLACDFGIKRFDILSYQTVDAGRTGSFCQLCDDYGLLMREDGTKLRPHVSKKPSENGGDGTGLYANRIR